jgi:endonuclease YncB( thermonuclease family)
MSAACLRYVTIVHDGCTLNLDTAGSTYKVRLDRIDAPELALPWGGNSSSALSSALLGKTDQVASNNTDKYGCIVGAVFADGCDYVNLQQGASGMLWFYKAYQCELSVSTRSEFMQVQQGAIDGRVDLWSQLDPEAPWFFRNGVEPVTPTCAGDAPTWPGNTPATTYVTMSTTTGRTTGRTSSGSVCYAGPRGDTYTITKSGNKNCGGC